MSAAHAGHVPKWLRAWRFGAWPCKQPSPRLRVQPCEPQCEGMAQEVLRWRVEPWRAMSALSRAPWASSLQLLATMDALQVEVDELHGSALLRRTAWELGAQLLRRLQLRRVRGASLRSALASRRWSLALATDAASGIALTNHDKSV